MFERTARLSRRRLLGALGVAGASALVAACAQATPTPAPKAPEKPAAAQPTPAAKPTEAPKPAEPSAPKPAAETAKPTEKPAVEAKPAAATPAAKPAAAGPAPAGEPIKIGASISTTGSNGKIGQYQYEAYLLWEEDVNKRGGLLGRPVKMTIYDDQTDPTTAAKLYEKLITDDKVDLVLGPYASNVTQAVAVVTEKYKQPMLAAGASASDIWKRNLKYVFGTYSVAEDYFKGVIDLGLKEGYKTAAIVHEDTLFPVSTANGTEAYAKEKGVQVVLKEKYPAKVTDVSSVLTKVRGLNPDMLLGGSYLPDSLLIVRQAKELDVNPKLVALSVGAAIPDFVQSLQKDANYVFGPSMWEPEVKTPGNPEFVKAYMAKWNREPDYHAASGWTGCQVLEAAVKKVGALDREKLRDALQALEMETIMPGKYKVDEKGMMVGHIPLVIQWQNEKKAIVYPSDMATGKHVLPTPPWKQR